MMDLDNLIKEKNKQRKGLEKKGRTIGVQLLSGEKVVGELVGHEPNILRIKDRKEGIVKDVHRATVVRFMLISNMEEMNDRKE